MERGVDQQAVASTSLYGNAQETRPLCRARTLSPGRDAHRPGALSFSRARVDPAARRSTMGRDGKERDMLKGRKIKTFLWFDGQAEEAARLYTSIFRDGKVGSVARYPEGSPAPAGSVMTIEFDLDGQSFVALNGGPQFKFKLLAGGGKPQQCGWLKDRFGVSWQVVPAGIGKIFSNPQTAPRAMQALLTMVKLDIAKL